jgi:hypothetical protein
MTLMLPLIDGPALELPLPQPAIAIYLTLPHFFRRSRDLQPAGAWVRSLPGLRASDFAGATSDSARTFAKNFSTLWA